MEVARLVHSALCHQKMEVRMKIDPVPNDPKFNSPSMIAKRKCSDTFFLSPS